MYKFKTVKMKTLLKGLKGKDRTNGGSTRLRQNGRFETESMKGEEQRNYEWFYKT